MGSPLRFCVLVILAIAPLACAQVDHSLWDAVLKRVVVPNVERKGIQFNAINFELLRTDAALRQQHLDYLQLLSTIDFTSLPQNEAVAFLINAYNAFATDLIVKENPKASINDLTDGRGSVFSRATWPMTKGGQVVQASLDAVEHQYLRMEITGQDDPRIHGAVNCMSLSCPDIRPEAYTGSNIEQQLNEQAAIWLQNQAKGIKINEATNEIWLSTIFQWFKDDFVSSSFGGKNDATDGLQNPLDYALKFATEEVKAYVAANAPTVQFLPYDWDLIAA